MLEPTTARAYRRSLVRQEATTTVVCEALEIETTGAPGFHDITDDVKDIVRECGITFGQVTVFSNHTTAAIRINENEPMLLLYMALTLRQLSPSNAYFVHNDFAPPTVNMNDDECANG